MGFMSFLASTKRVEFFREIPNGWSEECANLERLISEKYTGNFCVLLGDEDLLRDTLCQFVVHAEDDDIIAFALSLGGIGSSYRDGPLTIVINVLDV